MNGYSSSSLDYGFVDDSEPANEVEDWKNRDTALAIFREIVARGEERGEQALL